MLRKFPAARSCALREALKSPSRERVRIAGLTSYSLSQTRPSHATELPFTVKARQWDGTAGGRFALVGFGWRPAHVCACASAHMPYESIL